MSTPAIVLLAVALVLALIVFLQWRRDQRALRRMMPLERNGTPGRPVRLYDHERER